MSVENCRYGKAKGKRQEARVKRVWAILHFFTQFGFIVFTYLDGIITSFINYVRPEVKDFREAIEIFKQDLPTLLNSLRDLIDCQGENNTSFQTARDKFWGICKE